MTGIGKSKYPFPGVDPTPFMSLMAEKRIFFPFTIYIGNFSDFLKFIGISTISPFPRKRVLIFSKSSSRAWQKVEETKLQKLPDINYRRDCIYEGKLFFREEAQSVSSYY